MPIHGPLRVQPLPGDLKSFTTWLTECKSKGLYLHPSLAFIHNPRWQYGVGAYTITDLKAGTTVVKVPKQLILSVRTVSNNALRKLLQTDEFPKVIGLTIAYVYESCKKEESPFHGYLSSFSLPDVPKLWKKEEQVQLTGTEIATCGGLSLRDINFVFQKMVKPFFDKYKDIFPPLIETVTESVWAEAVVIVASRCFQIDNYHGMALVPIADMFNHTYIGNEDVSFVCDKEVCENCGELDPPCNCQNPPCDSCGFDKDTECICRPSKRQKTGSANEPTEEVLSVDPSGTGWKPVFVPHREPRYQDTCDMILTRDVTDVKQLFNNYGAYNNRELLSVYGFIDTNCQTDTVCFRLELFDHDTSYFRVSPERCEFWRQQGFPFCVKLSDHSHFHKRELEIILDRNECPPSGDPFVDWSLTVGLHGWIRFPLKVWMILCLLSSEEWAAFKALPMDGKVNFIHPILGMFESFNLEPSEIELFDKWLRLMENALGAREARYQETSEDPTLDSMHNKINPIISEGHKTRKWIASWYRSREIGICSDCHERVMFAFLALEKKRTGFGEGISINMALRGDEDPNQKE